MRTALLERLQEQTRALERVVLIARLDESRLPQLLPAIRDHLELTQRTVDSLAGHLGESEPDA